MSEKLFKKRYNEIKQANDQRIQQKQERERSKAVDLLSFDMIEDTTAKESHKNEDILITYNSYPNYEVVGSGSIEKVKLPKLDGLKLAETEERKVLFSPERTGDGESLNDDEAQKYIENIIDERIKNASEILALILEEN